MFGIEDRYDPPSRFVDSSDALHALATSLIGSDDFGDPDYLTGLEVLLLSLDYDPRLNDFGRRMVWGQLVNALAARGHAIKMMRQTPGFDRLPISRPVVITGIPRTGTTALHKLMAVDPRFQGLQTWLMSRPGPRPPRASWDDDPEFQRAVAQLEARYESNPVMRAAHEVVADEVDECLGILGQGFTSNMWASTCSVTSYDRWWQSQDELASYRYFRDVLQLVGSNAPGQRWLLKNPGHISHLDTLFAVFPDALVIQTHRDPAKAIPSLCAILVGLYPVVEGDRPELQRRLLGIRETELWAKAIRDAEPVRQAHRDRILDVVHGDFHRDPMGTIARIYDFIGEPLTDAVRTAMGERIAAAPEARHGEHRYSAADFGLDPDAVRARFGDYVARFDLLAKEARRKEPAS